MEQLSTTLQKYTNTNTSSSSDSVIIKNNTNTKTLAQVQFIATKLESSLGRQVPSRYEYYCKVAWQLPEHIIWQCLESASKGRSPQRLFSYLTAQYMKKATA